jgi:hypothetical protein
MKNIAVDVVEFADPGMHGVFLVDDTTKFARECRLQKGDVQLSFGLRYDEWLAVLIEAFDIDEKFDEVKKKEMREKRIFLTLGNELPGFPLFSRITAYFRDAIYQTAEIPAFREECCQLLNLTKNPKAHKGVEKMVMICDRAIASSKNLFFLGK